MKHWKQILALVLSGAMALSLFACGAGDNSESPAPSAAPSAELSAAPDASASPEIVADLSQGALEFAAGVSPDDVLLTVNNDQVPADVVLYLLGQSCIRTQQYMALYGMNLGDMPDMAGDLLEQGIELAVYHTLLRQKAAELGCLPTDAQNEEIRQALDEADLETNAPFWQLTDRGAEFVFALNTYYDNVLNAVTHQPTDQELEDYLAEQQVYRVKHILFKTVDDDRQPLPDDQIAEKKAKAEEVLSQLQAVDGDGLEAKFDELMMANSEDNPQNNPDGYTTTPGQMVAEFENTSLALKEGEMSGIVETEYGYHIILRLPLTDESREEYRANFRSEALEQQMDQWVEEADIVRAEALTELNAIDFYNRLAAYQQALSEKNAEG